MNSKQFGKIFIIIAIISCLVFITFVASPFSKPAFSKPLVENMNLGLDIKGGVSVVYEVETEAKDKELKDIVDQTKAIIAQRINALGLTEPNVYSQSGNRIVLEIPGVSDAKEALQLVGTTAILEFAQVKNGKGVVAGDTYSPETMDLLFAGNKVVNSTVGKDNLGLPAVQLELDSEGAQIFAKATGESINFLNGLTGKTNGQIAIMLDKKVVSAPNVGSVISNGRCIIQGHFTTQEARNLAILIKGGALPATLKEVKVQEIGPTLGLDALNSSLKGAVVGIILVMLVMIFNYRLPGFVSSISLVLYSTLTVILMILMKSTLTLPGVAGLVLSVGMAVDANVIIFERIKEELAQSKGLRASVEHGFNKTLSTILDSNITTLIASAVLFNFGEGAIKGFAVTLMFGIITSMFTAIFITKTLLLQFVYSDKFSDKKFYFAGGKK